MDEYDTPLQDAWLNGYWDELASFMRGFCNAMFKDNPWMERGLITGVTRVDKESIFSDFNNIKVVSTTSNLYSDCFGFTEQEVFAAMDEYGLVEKEEVKRWYDGFIFGSQKEIYNPWSIVCFLSERKLAPYWANTSSNALVGDLIAHGNISIKEDIEQLLLDKSIHVRLDEEIIFSQLYSSTSAFWSVLLASGYVKPLAWKTLTKEYEITLTNLESKIIFEDLISKWFEQVLSTKKYFLRAFLNDDVDEMNDFMGEIIENTFSYFDTGKKQGNGTRQSESFYHAFVLGLLIDCKDTYDIRSNRESGFGRYDVCMVPRHSGARGIVIEFKVMKPKKEKNLQETCADAVRQVHEKHYIDELLAQGVAADNIYVYGFAFAGKEVEICGGAASRLSPRGCRG